MEAASTVPFYIVRRPKGDYVVKRWTSNYKTQWAQVGKKYLGLRSSDFRRDLYTWTMCTMVTCQQGCRLESDLSHVLE